MSIKALNRNSLKALFSAGSRPGESNFSSLIDSTVNIVDDGISKNLDDGLILSPEGNESERLISFYKNIQDEQPQWSIELNNENQNGLGFVEPVPGKTEEANTRMFLQQGGKIGVGTVVPKTNFEVVGTLGMQSRVGTYKLATVPADGKWHTIIPDLNGCHAFEIVAQVGKQKSGKYALLHAIAMSTFGKSKSKIKTTQAHYGWWWNKIALRWTGSTYNFSLQMKSRSSYGNQQEIKFHITELWGNAIQSLFDQTNE